MSGRAVRKVTNDFYRTGSIVAKYVKKLTKSISNTTFIDPCAGRKDLYNVLPRPKKAFDKFDFPGVKKLDFLRSTRIKLVSPGKRITFVMNPPFSLGRQGNGVVAFLNHAASLMNKGETIICVAPNTMRKWKNIEKVDRLLHLKKEIVFTQAQSFATNSKPRRVMVCIQVWQLRTTPRGCPRLFASDPDFHVTMNDDTAAHRIFIHRWGMARNIGRVSTKTPWKIARDKKKSQCEVGTLGDKGGTAHTIVPARGKFRKVLKRLKKLHASGRWERYVQHTCAGNDNPAIVAADVYTMYRRGLTYLQKETYGVKVEYV